MRDSIILIAAAGAEDTHADTAHTTTASTGNPVTDIANTFKLKTELFVPQVILFLIVLYVLQKFAFKPIQAMLEERKARIAESLENARKIKVELAEAAATRKQIVDEASVKAKTIIEEAQAAAEKVRTTESQKAVAQAEEIIAKARQAAESDRAMMLAELKKEIGQLVVQTTTQVIGKVLTEEDKNRLIEETRKNIAA